MILSCLQLRVLFAMILSYLLYSSEFCWHDSVMFTAQSFGCMILSCLHSRVLLGLFCHVDSSEFCWHDYVIFTAQSFVGMILSCLQPRVLLS
jgi:hypothetical protein